MHPHPLGRPVDARRNLRLGDEGDARVAEIGEAHGIPGGLGLGSSPRKQRDISGRGRNHGFDRMKPVLGTPTGTGLGPTGGMAMQTPTPKISGNALFRCLRSTVTKPRGLVSPSMSRTAPTLRNAGSIMEKTNGNSTKPSNT